MSTASRIEIRRPMASSLRFQLWPVLPAAWAVVGLMAIAPLQSHVAAEEASTPVVTTLLEVVDADGNTPSDPSSLLYEGHTPAREPVLAPPYDVDPSLRQHLTLDDFDDVGGTGHIERVAGGTRLTLDMTGLIPNGVYTVWSDLYVAPGLTPDFANSIALGSFGATDGSENTFVAGADGTAQFEGIQPAGPMSIFGDAPAYVLDPPVSEYYAFLAYHINGQTYGGEPAPGGLEQTFVVQGMAGFISTIPEPNTLAVVLIGLAVTAMTNTRPGKRRCPAHPARKL